MLMMSMCLLFELQRISSPETDSGFGSSYLNQSATEAFQPNVLTGRSGKGFPDFSDFSAASAHRPQGKLKSAAFFSSIHSKCDDLNNSDSEASCSNLETTIHTVAVATSSSIKMLHCEAGAAAVELWVENTTQEPSVRLQSKSNLPHLFHH